MYTTLPTKKIRSILRNRGKIVLAGIVGIQIIVIAFLWQSSYTVPDPGKVFTEKGSADMCGVNRSLIPDEPTKDELYLPFEPNSTVHVDSNHSYSKEHVPYFVANFNSQGFRDEEFTRERKDDKFRVIVIGDSFTFGVGLNETDRYTEFFEREVNDLVDREVEVMNMGIGGRGMRDHFRLLYFNATDYDPDMVIVAFQKHNQVSNYHRRKFREAVYEDYGIETHEDFLDHEEAREAFDQKHIQFHRNLEWSDSDIPQYGNLMQYVSEREGFDLVFFDMEIIERRGYTDKVYEWDSKCSADVVFALDAVRNSSVDIEKLSFPEIERYNPAGNRFLGEYLAQKIEKKLSTE